MSDITATVYASSRSPLPDRFHNVARTMEKLKGVFNPGHKQQPQTAFNPSGSNQSRKSGDEDPTLPNPLRKRLKTEYSTPSPQDPPPASSFPDGVEVLYDCSEVTIDICFVHGLTGNRDTTWTANRQSIPWPKTLLPHKLKNALCAVHSPLISLVGLFCSRNRQFLIFTMASKCWTY